MALSNRDRISKALDVLVKGLRPFFEREMKAVHGESWLRVAAESVATEGRRMKGDEPARDVQALLKAMWDQWNVVFGRVLGQSERTLVSELRDVRNRWAHQEPFSTDDTYRALDSAHRLLSAISAPEAVEVDRQKQEVLRLRFEEEARKVTAKAAAAPTEGQPSSGLKPWREVITPHRDVASGRYKQAEFAADLGRVHRGEGEDEYKDPREFFRRTFITGGLDELLARATERLSGKGGDPVIELQTNFGGGKTHSLLALYHLFSGVSGADLTGVEPILKKVGVDQPPAAKRVVIVGTGLPPGQSWKKPDGTEIRTLWGEIAWQLGKKEGYRLVAKADASGTSPGAEVLVELLRKYAPCLILIDEWVAYARQLYGVDGLPAGSFDTHFTFAQAISEAAAAVPNALIVVSIPASDVEIGGEGGRLALDRVKKVIARLAVPWRPATADESFEIVRRRLFEPITGANHAARDAVVKGFAELYRTQSQEFPTGCKEGDYARRIAAAYPIHPELFDRLYEDWSSLEKFQRTRGVLRLMASVIHELWERQDGNLLIMPGTVPIDAPAVQRELTTYLEEHWVPVIERDVDGPSSLPLTLDRENPNLGRYSACRRVARTLYLGSAPTLRSAHRGLEDRSIKLGCVQPGEAPAIFGDALRRLTDRAVHLFVDGQRYWFSPQKSVARLAQERADNWPDDEVDAAIVKRLRADKQRGDFVAVHVVPSSSADVPDDDEARLIVLGPDHSHSAKISDSPARTAAAAILDSRGDGPRRFRNMLAFAAPDRSRLEDLRQGARQFLAWESIENEPEQHNLDEFQKKQVENRREEADKVVAQRINEAYQWALVPSQPNPQGPIEWHEARVQGQEPIANRASKKLKNEEGLICEFAPTRLRLELDRVPLWRGEHVGVKQLWEDFAQYLYLPRLKNREVLLRAAEEGLLLTSWEKDAFAYAEGIDETKGRYLGLRVLRGGAIAIDGRSLLVKPEAAKAQLQAEAQPTASNGGATYPAPPSGPGEQPTAPVPDTRPALRRFHGTKSLDPLRLGRDADQVADAIVQHLTGLLNASVEVTIEIHAEIPDGAPENVVRTVTENARTLKFKSHGFEKE